MGEHAALPGSLTGPQQRKAGPQGAPDAAERTTTTVAVLAGALSDPFPTQVEFGAGQGDDVDGIHHRGGLWQCQKPCSLFARPTATQKPCSLFARTTATANSQRESNVASAAVPRLA